MEEIGDGILEEIVLGLPLKSVIRFSCVSKSWSSIISSWRFIKRHRGRACGRERILVGPSRLNKSVAAYSGFLSSKTTAMKFTDKITSFPRGEKASCCTALCEGLFCVVVDSELLLWNPSTTSYKKLAPPPSKLRAPYQFIFGLGYDCVGDDYKLLLIPTRNGRDKETELYSLKSNSWRKIPSFHKSTRVKNQVCAFVNGALHWIDFPGLIVSFNLSSDKYVELAAPKHDDSIPDCVDVSVLKGKLCVTQRYGEVKFVLWLMEDYGIGTSWMKMLEIDYNKPLVPYPQWCMRPIYLYDNGNILLQVLEPKGRRTGVYLYDKRQATLKQLRVPVGTRLQYVFVYVESLMHL